MADTLLYGYRTMLDVSGLLLSSRVALTALTFTALQAASAQSDQKYYFWVTPGTAFPQYTESFVIEVNAA